jgi:carbon-monoxide dehydrogenase small subunit
MPEQASAPHANPLPTEEWGEGMGAATAAAASSRSWLGPAPGPVASTVSTPVSASPSALTTSTPPPPLGARGTRAPIRVSVGQMEEAGGETRIGQRFVLPHPRAAVWALMSDVEAMARCMPGLTLDGPPVGDKIAGRLEAKIGPIAASFAGEGTLQQLPAEFRQVVEGRGGDRRSGSRATGRVDYRLTALAGEDGAEATRVDVVIGYTLAGPLAQIGRTGLVRDLVRRIGEAFAHNLDARLHDPTSAMPQAQLGGLSLLLQVLIDRVRGLFSRLTGRGR